MGPWLTEQVSESLTKRKQGMGLRRPRCGHDRTCSRSRKCRCFPPLASSHRQFKRRSRENCGRLKHERVATLHPAVPVAIARAGEEAAMDVSLQCFSRKRRENRIL